MFTSKPPRPIKHIPKEIMLQIFSSISQLVRGNFCLNCHCSCLDFWYPSGVRVLTQSSRPRSDFNVDCGYVIWDSKRTSWSPFPRSRRNIWTLNVRLWACVRTSRAHSTRFHKKIQLQTWTRLSIMCRFKWKQSRSQANLDKWTWDTKNTLIVFYKSIVPRDLLAPSQQALRRTQVPNLGVWLSQLRAHLFCLSVSAILCQEERKKGKKALRTISHCGWNCDCSLFVEAHPLESLIPAFDYLPSTHCKSNSVLSGAVYRKGLTSEWKWLAAVETINLLWAAVHFSSQMLHTWNQIYFHSSRVSQSMI